MTTTKMPRRVLAKAVQLGVHNDCLVGSAENACPQCRDTINLSFDFFYGDAADLGTLMDRLLADIRQDREDDLV